MVTEGEGAGVMGAAGDEVRTSVEAGTVVADAARYSVDFSIVQPAERSVCITNLEKLLTDNSD